ncbi:hypothetical protein K2173_008378 [Erythroxylum novogranatense]|uniref:COP9 signalosome complex subunit 2 n=1 Tax=Erythroxylum novogranatense TaxID=1862640 RepID=A0AAV8TKZ1_9ROSI|nr:hypothetical protein K2173_008378 [Erythroxylum novogranatense]
MLYLPCEIEQIIDSIFGFLCGHGGCGFEYSDEEPEKKNIVIENQYYNSKVCATVAYLIFFLIFRGFKALKQTVKLYYRLGRYKEMMHSYREIEKCINNIMDFVSGSASQNFGLLQEFYQMTLNALEEAKNERLWFKTNLKLCKIWFDMGEYGRMIKILKERHKSCQREDSTDDQKKGSQLLEVYAVEIQMYTETKNNKKLKMRFSTLAIKSAIPHPRIMGIIQECGGKMHMISLNYDEAGNQRRIQCLKYLVLANMLMESEVNPFDEIINFRTLELNVPEKDVEQLLVSLILDNRIDGHIDQVNRLLERGDRSKGLKKYTAIDKWNSQLKSLSKISSNPVY